MFADAIKSVVHPATWAVLGIKRDGLGTQLAHRGTAFAVDTKGHLLTCWHVTYADQQCQVECDEFLVFQPELGPARYTASVLAKEKDRDIAILKITGDVKTRAAPLFGGSAPFGRSCAAFGHPLSLTDPVTQTMRIFTRTAAGIVSMPFDANLYPNTRPIKLYELDFFTHGGSSGGPVFLRNGNVFGFVRGSLLLDDGSGKQTRSNLSIAVSIQEAVEFLKASNVHVQLRGSAKR